MKIEGYVFAFVAVFMGVLTPVYWFTSHEATGTVALLFTAGLGTIIGSYLLVTARRMPPRPEDRPDAEIADGAGEIGFFSPASWWPLPVAVGVAIFALGFVFGYWLWIIAAGLFVPAMSGFLFEYYVTEQH